MDDDQLFKLLNHLEDEQRRLIAVGQDEVEELRQLGYVGAGLRLTDAGRVKLAELVATP